MEEAGWMIGGARFFLGLLSLSLAARHYQSGLRRIRRPKDDDGACWQYRILCGKCTD